MLTHVVSESQWGDIRSSLGVRSPHEGELAKIVMVLCLRLRRVEGANKLKDSSTYLRSRPRFRSGWGSWSKRNTGRSNSGLSFNDVCAPNRTVHVLPCCYASAKVSYIQDS